MNRQARRSLLAVLTPVALLALAGAAQAQTPPAAPPTEARPVRVTSNPQRDTLSKMMKPITIEFKEHRLEDVMRFIQDVSQADMEIFWLDDRNSVGLDKDMPITVRFDRGTALALLEKVLDKAATDTAGAGGNTWQLTEDGTFQVGPKERLNRFKFVKLYSINDLLLELPDYSEAPEFDLQSVLQSTGQGGGGGGGGQSPFRDTQQQDINRRPLAERAEEVMDILRNLVEQEQWVDNGGDGASMRLFQGSLIINAPDYIHRQIDGYPWWPAMATRVSMANGRRYVTLGVDTAANKVDGLHNQPVTGVVPNPPPSPPGR
jgi:hypothetical protein